MKQLLPTRMWINQPSTLQPLHKLHALNVLALLYPERRTARIYFLFGPVISMEVPTLCLSEGWLHGQDTRPPADGAQQP